MKQKLTATENKLIVAGGGGGGGRAEKGKGIRKATLPVVKQVTRP